MFVDELKIHITAGKGGDGVVRWRQEKFRPKGGPAGGNGGNGGDVYIQAVRDIGLLAQYAHKDRFVAESGEDGRKRSQHGKNGEDLIIDLPIGSVVTNLSTGESFELTDIDQKIRILKGGSGGLGNEYFKGATNQRPQEWTPGKKGGEADFSIELEMIVDAGLIGFPNAGKSSLLNALTHAHSRVGSYEFTTLAPHLGDLYGFILADIPGLIEGASSGKGLGHKFLRHIKRTKVLIHCVSLQHEDVYEVYRTLRKELKEYSPELEEKPEIIVLTKSDEVSDKKIEEAKETLKSNNIDLGMTRIVSILDDNSIKELSDFLVSYFREK